MDQTWVFLFLYTVLILFDLIPAMKKKDKKALYVSIPIYLLTLTVNLMSSFGFSFPALNPIIGQFIQSIFHMQ